MTLGASDLHILCLVFFGYDCMVTKGHECLLRADAWASGVSLKDRLWLWFGLYVSASGNDPLTQPQMAHGQGDEGQRV